jgi:nicotinamide-nucleotide amidase
MRAAILAVGTELLSTDRLDTNSLRLTSVLERHGVALRHKAVVGDEEAEIAAALAEAARRAELVLVSGGLGPTADDVTREACARWLGRPLEEDPALWAAIERRFASLGRTPAGNNRRQAMVVAGATVLHNPRGTAPGQRVEADGVTVFLFPGVPFELETLVELHLVPWLAERSGGRGRERRTVRVAMRPESDVDRELEPAYAEFGRETITVLSSPGEVRVRLTVEGAEEERLVRLDQMAGRVRELLGEAVYGEGEELVLEQVVGGLLAARRLTVATAESCTGGLLAERLTRVPGSSRYFPGGVVAYADAQKVSLLGVPAPELAEHGAVSEEVARALAEGVRRRLGTDFGLGVTGVAGPEGGSDEKPVGTVHVALAGPAGVRHRRLRLPGDRVRVRWQATQAALEMLRLALGEATPEGRP